MDFSSPFVKQVSALNRHPSTIEGYRTAIVDSLDPAGLNVSQSLELTDYFHRG